MIVNRPSVCPSQCVPPRRRVAGNENALVNANIFFPVSQRPEKVFTILTTGCPRKKTWALLNRNPKNCHFSDKRKSTIFYAVRDHNSETTRTNFIGRTWQKQVASGKPMSLFPMWGKSSLSPLLYFVENTLFSMGYEFITRGNPRMCVFFSDRTVHWEQTQTSATTREIQSRQLQLLSTVLQSWETNGRSIETSISWKGRCDQVGEKYYTFYCIMA